MREGWIPATLSPLWETLGLMFSNVGIIKLEARHESTRNTFETPWGKLRNLLGMKLTTNVTLLLLSAVDNDIFVYFFCHKNVCYVRVRVTHTIKVNIKETIMGNDGFLQLFIWWMYCSQNTKVLLLDKLSILSGKGVFLLLWETLNLY